MADNENNDDKTATVTIDAPPAPEASEAKPTRAQLEKEGWTKEEIESAEKRGMVGAEPAKKPAKPAEPKEAEEPEPEAEASAESEEQPEPEESEPKDKKKDEKPQAKAGGLPDYKFTPEEEAGIVKLFGKGHPVRAFYFRAKNERQARQSAEAREKAKDAKLAALEAQLAGKKPAAPAEGEGTEDLDSQPLTVGLLKKMQEDARKAEEEEKAKARDRQAALAKVHQDQEDYARGEFEDFDDTITLAKEVISNLDKLVTEPRKRAKVLHLLEQMQVAYVKAADLGLDGYTTAMIGYEIGQLHPNYGKPKGEPKPEEDGPSEDDPKARGGLTAEKLKRIEEVSQRRGSSAQIKGGAGKRTIAAEDMDLTTLNAMPYAQRKAFREQHPKVYARLMRG